MLVTTLLMKDWHSVLIITHHDLMYPHRRTLWCIHFLALYAVCMYVHPVRCKLALSRNRCNTVTGNFCEVVLMEACSCQPQYISYTYPRISSAINFLPDMTLPSDCLSLYDFLLKVHFSQITKET